MFFFSVENKTQLLNKYCTYVSTVISDLVIGCGGLLQLRP
jgi:hypothetical protein